MIIEIFKPNKSVKGHAFFIEIMPDLKAGRDGLALNSIFLRFVKQDGWNEKTSNGSFGASFGKEGKDVRIKFSEFEIGALIRFLTNGKPWSTVHKYNDNTTQITASTFEAGSGNYKRVCYSISIIQNGSDRYSISLEMGEGECVKKALEVYLSNRYEKKAKYSIDYHKNQKNK